MSEVYDVLYLKDNILSLKMIILLFSADSILVMIEYFFI